MTFIDGNDIFTETMAYKIAVFLYSNNEFTTGNVVFKYDNEYLQIDKIRVDDEGDFVFDLKD